MPGTLTVRRIAPSDTGALERFYEDLSPESRRLRFLSAGTQIGSNLLRDFCGPDHEHREGFVAVATAPDGVDRLVGHLCLEPTAPDEMEIAVVMEVDRSTATKAMKIGFARRGEVPPTRSELCSRGGKKSPKGQADRDRELAGLAGPLYVAGQTGKEVARALSIDPATARNAIRNWYILSNLPMPNFRSDANNRRQASKASAVTSAA